MPETTDILPSTFTANLVDAEVGENRFRFRILKMHDSVFIHISEAEYECLNEMAVAMPMRDSEEVVSTAVTGPLLGCDSKEFALKISKRLRRQVYLSCNVGADRLIRPLLEKRLVEEIKLHPEWF